MKKTKRIAVAIATLLALGSLSPVKAYDNSCGCYDAFIACLKTGATHSVCSAGYTACIANCQQCNAKTTTGRIFAILLERPLSGQL